MLTMLRCVGVDVVVVLFFVVFLSPTNRQAGSGRMGRGAGQWRGARAVSKHESQQAMTA